MCKKINDLKTPDMTAIAGEGRLLNSRIKGFTLSETMIVLIVLGVVASLTIPALVRRQIEAAERAKIKKSMTVYDYLFNKMVTENDIKSNPELQTFAPNGDCTNTAPYFKGVENKDNNICKFKTSDGVWWDISDITHPNISLNKDDLDNPDSKKTFTLVGHFDDNGSVRVDDLAHEQGNNLALLTKLYEFSHNKKTEYIPTSKLDDPNSILFNPFPNECPSDVDCNAVDNFEGPDPKCRSCTYYNNYGGSVQIAYSDDGRILLNIYPNWERCVYRNGSMSCESRHAVQKFNYDKNNNYLGCDTYDYDTEELIQKDSCNFPI